MAARDRATVAQAGQVDVLVPGEQQPDVVLDRGVLRMGQVEPYLVHSSVEHMGEICVERRQLAHVARQQLTIRGGSGGSPWERGPISDVHARTSLKRCAVPAPIGVTFPTPPAFQFSPASRLI